MKEEFRQFMSASEMSPPWDLSEKVLREIKQDLRVNQAWLFLKLLLIHALVGAVTLTFCPQFSIGPVGKGIMPALYALMEIHPLFCAAFCGMLFLGSSALVSVLALRSSELMLVKRKTWWIYSLLAAVSLVFFMLAGSDFRGHYHWEFILTWSIAAIVSAWGIVKMGTWLRLKSWNLMPV